MAETGSTTLRYFGREAALFLGPLPKPEVHSHHALQGCVALDGSLSIDVGLCAPLDATAALIGPDAPHAVVSACPVGHFYVQPESEVGSRIVATLAARPVLALESERLDPVRELLVRAQEDPSLLPECLDALLDRVLEGAPPPPPRDDRVVATLELLGRGSADTPLAELAREAGLSPDRLRHRIREQVGIPLRRYRRWLRLVRAIEILGRTGSVTQASCEAGFADSAHLSRAFSEFFTFPPSVFVRDSRFVQAGRLAQS